MNGGIGAVSVGISEWVLEALSFVVLALLVLGGWKLLKLVVLALKG